MLDTRRVVDLPLNGRNAASLALITDGTVLAPAGADEGNTKTFRNISENGTRQNQTSFRLDGAMNDHIYTNVNQPFPFPDALEEFSVRTTNYSARYGGNAGGVVNIVTKSGKNEEHGDASEFDAMPRSTRRISSPLRETNLRGTNLGERSADRWSFRNFTTGGKRLSSLWDIR